VENQIPTRLRWKNIDMRGKTLWTNTVDRYVHGGSRWTSTVDMAEQVAESYCPLLCVFGYRPSMVDRGESRWNPESTNV